jgi:Formamidopyrimidine-DNA glycosylase
MPELPEVETTVKGLSVILNQKISNVKIHTSKLRFKIPNNIINILRNSKISNLRRIGKFIIIDLDTDYSLVIHLGMSRRLKLSIKATKE